jgi:hypothetical protein
MPERKWADEFVLDVILHAQTEGGTMSDPEGVLVEKFAAVRAAERERCAQIALDYDGDGHKHGLYTQLGDSVKTQHDIAAAIREGK